MRILYLHQYFNTPDMTGGTRSYEMARRLVLVGHSVDMITSQRVVSSLDHTSRRRSEIDGIHVHWLPVPYSNYMGYGRRLQAFFSFAWRAASKAAYLGGDVIFATSTPLTIALPAVYAAKRLKIPMVFEVRDLWPELPIAVGAIQNRFAIQAARWLENFAYINASHIIALSPGMKEGVAATGYPEARISVIPNSCDVDLFQVPCEAGTAFLSHHSFLKGGPLVVYAGTLGHINGVHYLVHIAASMKALDPTVRFLIVGDGQQKAFVIDQAEKMGVLEKNFWIISEIPKNEIPKILSASTIATSLFIDLPEMWNNSANKFFDSLAAGRPIMINYGGWQAELLKQSGAGLIVPPQDAKNAAHMLHQFISDKKRLDQASKAASYLADRKFNRNHLAKKLNYILEEVVERHVK